MATNKPSSPFVWATGAASTRQDPGATKKALGWVTNESPASTVFNWLQNYYTSFIAAINDHGVAPWDANSAYANGALCYHNGTIWKRTTAGSGGSQPGATNSPWAIAFSSTLGNQVNVDVPGDYATLQDAFNAFRYSLPNDKIVTINIESGHSPSSGIDCANGNFGFIRIVSEDNEVTVSGSWPSTEDFIKCTNGIAPELHTTINMADNGRHGLNLDKATGFILDGKGIKNTGSSGAELQKGSTLIANACDLSGAGTYGIRALDASTADINGSDCSGAGNVGVEANDGSRVNATAVNATAAGSVGIQSSAAHIVAPNSDTSGATSVGYAVINGGILSRAGGTGSDNVAALNTITAGGFIMA